MRSRDSIFSPFSCHVPPLPWTSKDATPEDSHYAGLDPSDDCNTTFFTVQISPFGPPTWISIPATEGDIFPPFFRLLLISLGRPDIGPGFGVFIFFFKSSSVKQGNGRPVLPPMHLRRNWSNGAHFVYFRDTQRFHFRAPQQNDGDARAGESRGFCQDLEFE